jgi:hypothetical protein
MSLRQRGDPGCVSERSGGDLLASVVEAEEEMTDGRRVNPESDKRAAGMPTMTFSSSGEFLAK